MKSIFTLLIHTALFATLPSCFAADAQTETLCKTITSSKKPIAAVVTEEGKPIESEIDLGLLNTKTGEWHNDYILSSKKYRLITFPKRFSIKENLSQSYYIKKSKTKPMCNKTAETIITIGVRPESFKKGIFKIEELFTVDDLTADFENQYEVEYKFKNTAFGTIQ